MENYALMIAKKALELGAIRLSPQKPFLWASGFYMPIYNDNRSLLADWQTRENIAKAFELMLQETAFSPENIAGTATAGIAHATTLADRLKVGLSYVRSSSKDHGLSHQIEGLGISGSYSNKRVLVLEDLISTGSSSISAVKAVVAAQGVVPYCFGIFTYGLSSSKEAFAALDPKCEVKTVLDYDYVIEYAKSIGYISNVDYSMLKTWKDDPFGWGIKHGYDRVIK